MRVALLVGALGEGWPLVLLTYLSQWPFLSLWKPQFSLGYTPIEMARHVKEAAN
jgi:hypothetical protein